MKAQELRIGNIISPLGKGVTVVEGISTWDDLIQSSNFAERSIEDFEPIPITEERLLKFGFKEVNCKEDYNREFFKTFEIRETEKKFSLRYYIVSKKIYFNFDIGYGDNEIEIKYVHQLQNLYLVLTGEELVFTNETIKEWR